MKAWAVFFFSFLPALASAADIGVSGPNTMRVLETDGSPDARVKVLKFGNGQLTIDGSTAIITITGSVGGGGGGGALFLQPNNVSVSSIVFAPGDFRFLFDTVAGGTLTVKNSSGAWTAAQTFRSSITVLNASSTFANGTVYILGGGGLQISSNSVPMPQRAIFYLTTGTIANNQFPIFLIAANAQDYFTITEEKTRFSTQLVEFPYVINVKEGNASTDGINFSQNFSKDDSIRYQDSSQTMTFKINNGGKTMSFDTTQLSVPVPISGFAGETIFGDETVTNLSRTWLLIVDSDSVHLGSGTFSGPVVSTTGFIAPSSTFTFVNFGTATIMNLKVAMPSKQGTAGQVLKNEGTGILYWASDNDTGGAAGAGDSFGSHKATQPVDMANFGIGNSSGVNAGYILSRSSITAMGPVVSSHSFVAPSATFTMVNFGTATINTVRTVLPSAQGGSGQVPKNDGNGNWYWADDNQGAGGSGAGDNMGSHVATQTINNGEFGVSNSTGVSGTGNKYGIDAATLTVNGVVFSSGAWNTLYTSGTVVYGAAFSTVTNLMFQVEPNSLYSIKGVIMNNTHATTEGYQFQLFAPSGSSGHGVARIWTSAAVNGDEPMTALFTPVSGSAGPGATIIDTEYHAQIITGSLAGQAGIMMRAEVSNPPNGLTIRKGSWLSYVKVE